MSACYNMATMWGLIVRRLGGAFAMYLVGKHVFPKLEQAAKSKYADLKKKRKGEEGKKDVGED